MELMSARIQPRRGTAAEWTAADPVLAIGELGYETDSGLSKRGTGADKWSELKYSDISTSGRSSRPNGPRLGVLGDSLHALGFKSATGSGVFVGLPLIFRRIEWLSHGRLRMTDPHQDLGDQMDDVLTTQLPALLAADPLPNACALAIGRNDANSSFYLPDYLDDYTYIAQRLMAAGIVPIFLTPMPTGAEGSPTDPADSKLRLLRAGIMKLGPELGVPVFDQWACLDADTGGVKAEYDNLTDTTHLNYDGYGAVADSLIEQGICDLFPATIPLTIKDSVDPNDIMAGVGLFGGTTPPDGTGWGYSGTGTSPEFVAADSSDGIAGKWAKVTKVSGSTAIGYFRWVTWTESTPPTVTPGHTYRFSFTMYLDGTWAPDDGLHLSSYVEWWIGSGGTKVQTDWFTNRWGSPDRITVSQDFECPATADGLRFIWALNGTAVDDQHLYVGEVSILDITAIGL